MTNQRAGYHNCSLQLPQAVWDALCADADRQGESVSRVLAGILQRHYRLPADAVPPRKRPGRKPKQDPAP